MGDEASAGETAPPDAAAITVAASSSSYGHSVLLRTTRGRTKKNRRGGGKPTSTNARNGVLFGEKGSRMYKMAVVLGMALMVSWLMAIALVVTDSAPQTIGLEGEFWWKHHHPPPPLRENDAPPAVRASKKKQLQGHPQPQMIPKKEMLVRMDSPLLIFTCARPDYLRRTLGGIYRFHPMTRRDEHKNQIPILMGTPIVISQDGTNEEVRQVILEYQKQFQAAGVPLYHLQHDQSSTTKMENNHLRGGNDNAYKALAVHYGWALGQLFSGTAYHSTDLIVPNTPPLPRRVILLEEDLDIATDFFDYMAAMAPLLDVDPSLLAVSAFNDNGKVVGNSTRMLRSDFFPGLGWMMTRRLWIQELESKWPTGWWDDWLREPDQRKHRKIIRPEVSRTYHFGTKSGASSNQFGKDLTSIHLNEVHVSFWEENLIAKRIMSPTSEEEYHAWYAAQVNRAIPMTDVTEAVQRSQSEAVRLSYTNWNHFQQLATKLHLMTDEKAGVARTSYRGIVETRPKGTDNNGHLLYLVPSNSQHELLETETMLAFKANS